MNILAIDPGPTQSGWVELLQSGTFGGGILPNAELLSWIKKENAFPDTHVVIERVKSYGKAVGDEVFETCVWTGRFQQAVYDTAGPNTPVCLMPRLNVKLHFCHSARAKGTEVNHALWDRFGGRRAAKGTKRAPGPLYAIKSHSMAALALAMTYAETVVKETP